MAENAESGSGSGSKRSRKNEQAKDPQQMARLILTDGRYPLDAFEFLHHGLEHAAEEVYGDQPREPGERHVSGAQLCLSLRDLALKRWGPLARTVLTRWRINDTLDFGRMVFLLVDNGFMQKTPQDRLEDFRAVYDFDQAFAFESATCFKLRE